MKYISSIRKTFQGAWEISGTIGTRQYMGYPLRVAITKYNKEARKQK